MSHHRLNKPTKKTLKRNNKKSPNKCRPKKLNLPFNSTESSNPSEPSSSTGLTAPQITQSLNSNHFYSSYRSRLPSPNLNTSKKAKRFQFFPPSCMGGGIQNNSTSPACRNQTWIMSLNSSRSATFRRFWIKPKLKNWNSTPVRRYNWGNSRYSRMFIPLLQPQFPCLIKIYWLLV